MFVILSVIYRPIEQLLSRTIADRRARGLHGHPLRIPAADPGRLRAALPGRRAGAAPADRERACSTARRPCTGSSWSACWPTRPATSPAAGWPAISASPCTAGSCSWSRPRAFCSRWRWRSGSPPARTRSALGMAVAPFVSLAVIPFAFSRIRVRAPGAEWPVADAAREGPAHAEVEEATTDLSLQHGAGFAVAVVGIMLAEQTLMNAGVLIVAANAGAGAALTARPDRLRVQRDADRARAAAAVPGDPDLDPPPPGRPRGARERGRVPPRDPDHDPGDRRVRAGRGARPAGDRPAGDDRAARRQGLSTTGASGWRWSGSGWACTWSPGRSTRRPWPAGARAGRRSPG